MKKVWSFCAAINILLAGAAVRFYKRSSFFLITNYIYFYRSIEKHNRSNGSTSRLCVASTPLQIFNSKPSDKGEIEHKI